MQRAFLRDDIGLEGLLVDWQDAPREHATSALLHLWQSLANEAGRLPCRSQLSSDHLRLMIGKTLLIDVEDDGREFRYRLFSSEMAKVLGVDLTGQRISETPNAQWRHDICRAVLEQGAPLCARVKIGVGSVHPKCFEMIYLPLRRGGEDIAMIAAGFVPL